MTRQDKISMVALLMKEHPAHLRRLDKEAKYNKIRRTVDEFTGKCTGKWGDYIVTYDDTTTSSTDWEAIAEALGMTVNEAKAKYTTKAPAKKFKGVTEAK